jgi:hypothetical protein
MTLSEREHLEKLERRIQELERSRASSFTRPQLLVIPLAAVALLAAAAPSTVFSALESRLLALESAIRVGPDGAVQTRGPFQVMDPQGRVLFSVGRAAGGAVTVTRPAGPGGPVLAVTDAGGQERASMMLVPGNHGRIETYDGAGHLSAMLNEAGLNVHDPAGKLVAGVTRGRDGLGRVAVLHNETQTATELTKDAKGNGRVVSYSAAGKIRSALFGETGVKVFDDAEMDVVSILNRNSRGVVGVKNGSVTTHLAELTVDSLGGGLLLMKASNGLTSIGLLGSQRRIALGNAAGKSVAELAVSSDGRGLVQVFGKNQKSLVVLTEDAHGGLLQIKNGSGTPVAHLMTAVDGGGYWQLTDPAGNPVVDAGATKSGLGLVRAGPVYLCTPPVGTAMVGVAMLPDCIRGIPKP